MPEDRPEKAKHACATRRGQYLITTQAVTGLAPLATDAIEESIRAMPDIEHVKTLAPRGLAQVLSAGAPGPTKVIVARMTEQRAQALRQTAPPQVILEEDLPLRYAAPDESLLLPFESAAIAPTGEGIPVAIQVIGPNNRPVPQANVYILGAGFPAQGVTDAGGQTTLTVFGGSLDTIQALYIKPSADFWTLFLKQPELLANQVNVVTLRPLSETFPGFPAQSAVGWGQKLMNMDKLPATFTGKGIKVAIVDSGCATTHPDLDRVTEGLDLTNNSPVTWKSDTVFHGSHVAGVVGGVSPANVGIRGFAPEAQIHVCKIFPGGRFSDLISALDYCIEHQIDVVNLSLGSDQVSQTLEQKIVQARQLGVACIVAAGNSGGPVQYPAASANVLAVSAIGKLGEFPQDSYHAQTILGDRRLLGPDGIFAAKFSCFGPQVGVAGPGVAILSSVPPQNYAAWDGTSMAAPHITGLAALILAHHPDFAGSFNTRNEARVARLFQILKTSARPLNLGDPNRVGSGVPDALKAFPGLSAPAPQPTPSEDMLQRLMSILHGAPAAQPALSIDQLRRSLEQAGLARPASVPAAAVFQPASATGVAIAEAPAPTTTLSQIRQQLQELGI